MAQYVNQNSCIQKHIQNGVVSWRAMCWTISWLAAVTLFSVFLLAAPASYECRINPSYSQQESKNLLSQNPFNSSIQFQKHWFVQCYWCKILTWGHSLCNLPVTRWIKQVTLEHWCSLCLGFSDGLQHFFHAFPFRYMKDKIKLNPKVTHMWQRVSWY